MAGDAIQNANIPDATKQVLLQQLKDKTAVVRIIGTAQTTVTDTVRQAITDKSGFQVLKDILVLP